MGDVEKTGQGQRAWRSDDLAQAMVDRMVERAENPMLTLIYGRVRPVVAAQIEEIFAPVEVKQKGRRRR